MGTTSSPFGGAGELRAAYEAVDWSATPLGHPDTWGRSLRQALDLMLSTKFGIVIGWGPDLVMLYNAAYVDMIGAKHPDALGRPLPEVFAESWDQLGPLFEQARSGDAVWFEDMPVKMDRYGFLEETYFTFSYSGVTGDDGAVAGVMDIAAETTRQVLDHRRLELLARLGDVATDLGSVQDVAGRALDVLRTAPLDLPVVELQLPGRPAQVLPPAPQELRPRQVLVVDGTAWVRVPGDLGHDTVVVLAARLSPELALDAAYRDFVRLVAATVGDALSAAASYQAERARADEEAWHGRRLRGLVAIAQALPDCEDEVDVLRVLVRGAGQLVGADGVVLGVLEAGQGDEARSERLHVLGDELDPASALLARALDGVTVTGDLDSAGGGSVAAFPLLVGDRTTGALGLSWRELTVLRPQDHDVLSALAASTAQAVDRVRAQRAERQSAAAVRSLAETLQRSLLTTAPAPHGLDISVRYLPAAEYQQVGGDWHDAFRTAAGSTCLVIGDVTGHDQEAAAAMGQVRNLLRGIGYSLEVSPAAALAALDRAMRDLGVGALATAVLATVEPVPPLTPQGGLGEGVGAWRLRWSNAGHPPPMVISPDGTVDVLRTTPDLLLGLDADQVRADHVHGLVPGATVLLYTDGLVERRGASIDDGLGWLASTVAGFAGGTPDDVCDAVLALVEGHAEDDVAVLAVRVRA